MTFTYTEQPLHLYNNHVSTYIFSSDIYVLFI